MSSSASPLDLHNLAPIPPSPPITHLIPASPSISFDPLPLPPPSPFLPLPPSLPLQPPPQILPPRQHFPPLLLLHSPSVVPFSASSASFLLPPTTNLTNWQVPVQSVPQVTASPAPPSSALRLDLSASAQFRRTPQVSGECIARLPFTNASVLMQSHQGRAVMEGRIVAPETHGHQQNSDSTPRVLPCNREAVDVQVNVEEQGASSQCDDVQFSYASPATTATAAAEQPCITAAGTKPHHGARRRRGGSGEKYIITSPSWLPDGWVTEAQIRQSGNTAGARDKYYKDLTSGRRFRSRNEVLNFLKTGKGRPRRRETGNALIAHIDPAAAYYSGLSSSVVDYQLSTELNQNREDENEHANMGFLINPFPTSHHASLIVQDFSLSAVHQGDFSTPTYHESFYEQQSLSPEVDQFDSHSGFIGFSLPPVPDAPEILSNPHLLLPSSSTHPFAITGNEPKTNAPQTQILHTKASKTFFHDMDIDPKQASSQWVQKSAPKSDEPSEMISISSESSVEQLSEGQERTTVEDDLERGIEAAQRTVELGKDVQTAQRTVIHLGKEMKTLVEKLGHNVQVVQKAVKRKRPDDTVDNNRKVDLGKHTIERANDAMCNAIEAAQTIDAALANAVQAAQKIDGAMGNIIQASQNLEVAMNNMIQATHDVLKSDSSLQVTTNIIQTSPPANVTRKTLNPLVENVINSNHQGSVALSPEVQRAQQPAFAMANIYSTCQTFDADLSGKGTQDGLLPNQTGIMQEALTPVVAVADSATPIQPAKMPPRVVTASVIQPVQTSLSTDGRHSGIPSINGVTELAQPCTTAVIEQSQLPIASIKQIEEQITHSYNGAISDPRDRNLRDNKQVANVKSRKFSPFNPKFDLSMIHPNMTSRQRAKMVQKMKTMHGRGLLAALGRELCYLALGRKVCFGVLSCEPYTGSSPCQGWINDTNNPSIIKKGKANENKDLWSQDAVLYFEPDALKETRCETQPEFDHFLQIEHDMSTDDASEEAQ